MQFHHIGDIPILDKLWGIRVRPKLTEEKTLIHSAPYPHGKEDIHVPFRPLKWSHIIRKEAIFCLGLAEFFSVALKKCIFPFFIVLSKGKKLKPLLFNRFLATPAGLEPATLCLEGRCSIQLSYEAAGKEIEPKVA